MSKRQITKDVIPNYEITFHAENVTPKQREFFFDLFDAAFDEIVQSKTISAKDSDKMTFGETKVSETDWSSPKDWVL